MREIEREGSISLCFLICILWLVLFDCGRERDGRDRMNGLFGLFGWGLSDTMNQRDWIGLE